MVVFEKLIRVFIYRDLIFIFAGAVFLVSIISITKGYTISDDFISLDGFLFLGFSYIIGFAIQEVFSCIKITTTKVPKKYCKLVYFFYNRINHVDNDKLFSGIDEKKDIATAKKFITSERENDELRIEQERIVVFKSIGMTVGPSLVLTGLLYIISNVVRISDWFNWHVEQSICLGVTLLLFGITLILLGWVKTARLASFRASVWDSMSCEMRDKYKSI